LHRNYSAVYDVSDRINPLYLRGDFDGDGLADYAILTVQVKTKKRGIAVWLSATNKMTTLGAGSPVQYGQGREDDLNFDRWRIVGNNPADVSTSIQMPPGLHADAIFVEKLESASGIFYLKRGKFLWFQQGD